MIILVLILSIFLILITLTFGSLFLKENFGWSWCIFYLLLAAFGFVSLFVILIANPSAKDVYRGKTELRITYDGNIPVDTTVIYKKQYK